MIIKKKQSYERKFNFRKNLYEAAEMLRSNKRMIKLTYAERVYLQQWFYPKTGNRILNRACDIEQALIMFYNVVLDEKTKTKKQAEAEINEDKTTEKKTTAKKTTTTKTKKVEDNETKESEKTDDKLQS
jgi:hypothetical protein